MKLFSKLAHNAQKLFNKANEQAPVMFRKFNNTVRKVDNSIQRANAGVQSISKGLNIPVVSPLVSSFSNAVASNSTLARNSINNAQKTIKNGLEKAISTPLKDLKDADDNKYV